ncbi:MAG: divalent-cation tolerance protein CutA [Opitutia bacterium]
MSETLRVALTTLPDREAAERLAAAVVSEGLAACAQVEGPITSHYRWEGRVCREQEWRLALKTDPARENALRDRVHALHPHRVPQWLVLGATASEAYLAWARPSSP